MMREKEKLGPSTALHNVPVAQLLHEAALYLGETLDPEKVYDRLHELLAAVVPHDGLLVSAYDPETNLITGDYAWVDGAKLDATTFPPLTLNPHGEGMQSRVIRSGQSLLINNVAERVQNEQGTFYTVDGEGHVRKVPETGPPPTRAAIMTPVKLAGQVLGVVQVMSDHQTYTQEQLTLVEGLTTQMAAAARNAKLYQAAQREAAEHQKTAESLRQSEERFRALANALPAIVWTAAPDGTITFANDQWLIYSGLTPEETAHRWPELALHPDDYDRCLAEWHKALGEGLDYQIEVRNRRYDGQYRWFLTQAVPARDAEGRVTAWYGTTTDIHERKQAELNARFLADLTDKMRRIENPSELLQTVVEQLGEHLQVSRCLMAEVDVARGQEIFKPDYHRGLPSAAGLYSFTEFSPQTLAELQTGRTVVVGDARRDPRTAAHYEQTYGRLGVGAYVVVPQMRDGRWVSMLWASVEQPHIWSQQEVGLLEAVADRAWLAFEKARLDSDLRRETELLQKLFDNMPVMIAMYRPDTSVLEVNREFTRLTGWSEEDANRGDFMAKCYPDPATREEVWGLMDSLPAGWHDITMTTQDGQTIETSWSNMRLSDETHIGIGIDIRERKRTQEALEEMVRERTAQVRQLASALTQTEEFERQQLSRDLHDSAGQLLTALQIYLSLLEDEVPEEFGELRQKVADARQLAQQASEEVRAISHAMRPLTLDRLGLAVALDELCHDFGRRTGLAIHFQADKLPPLEDQVSVNFYRFAQEALANTARHAQANDVKVALRVEDGQLSLSVADDGVGFDVQRELSLDGAVAGLGLRSLQERFQMLGGRVTIDSAPGRGARLLAQYRL